MSKLFKHGLIVITLKSHLLGGRPGVLGGLTIACTARSSPGQAALSEALI